MGSNQAGDWQKSADGFKQLVDQVKSGTNKPMIMTEFGQFCCDTHGSCYQYNGSFEGQQMGYVEAVMSIAAANGISWTPWAWRPGASEAGWEGHNCTACVGLPGLRQ